MSALGDLVIRLMAETSEFRAGLEKATYMAEKSFRSITSSAKTLAGGIGLYFSADAFVGWVRGAIEAAAALDNLSARTGLATDVLSKFQYAARLSDVSNEDFAISMQKFSKSVAEAARNTGEAIKAFDAMGISVKNSLTGALKSSDQLLLEVADKFLSYEDGANKAAIAQALFGKAGQGMIEFLNRGSTGIQNLGKELERLGGVVFPDAAKRANDFTRNIESIKTSSSALAMAIGNDLIPWLNKLATEYLIAEKNALNFFDKLALGLSQNFYGNLQKDIANVTKELENLNAVGAKDTIFYRSAERRLAYLKELASVQALSGANEEYSDQISRRMAAEARAAGNKQGKGQAPALAETIKAQKVVADEAQRLIDKQIQAVQKLTMSDEELAVAEVFLAGGTMQQVEASQRLADVLKKRREEQEALKDSTERALELYKEYKQLYEATASPVQKLADEEARLLALRERLVANGYDVIAVDKMIAEARLDAYEKAFPTKSKDDIERMRDIAREFGQVIGTAFEDAVIRGNSLRDVIKGIEQDMIRIIMRRLVTNNLEKFLTDVAVPAISSAFGGGGFWSTLFGGARASGGPVFPNQAYLVGERGPEIFMPNKTGTVLPNTTKDVSNTNQNGFTVKTQPAPTVSIINHFVINGTTDRRSQQQIAAQTGLAVQRAIGRNT